MGLWEMWPAGRKPGLGVLLPGTEFSSAMNVRTTAIPQAIPSHWTSGRPETIDGPKNVTRPGRKISSVRGVRKLRFLGRYGVRRSAPPGGTAFSVMAFMLRPGRIQSNRATYERTAHAVDPGRRVTS